MQRKLHILLLLIAVLTACVGAGPQRPSQRNGKRADEKSDKDLALISLNQRLAAEADKEILAYVQTQSDSYAQMESGAWLRYLSRNDEGETPHEDEEWTVQLVVRSLQDSLLIDSEQTYHIGRETLPVAVEILLRELHHDESVRLICPWYVGYGIYGNEYVNAYQNVIIDVMVK